MEKTSTFGSRATVARALAVRDRALSMMLRRSLSRDRRDACRAFPAPRVVAKVLCKIPFALVITRLHSGDRLTRYGIDFWHGAWYTCVMTGLPRTSLSVSFVPFVFGFYNANPRDKSMGSAVRLGVVHCTAEGPMHTTYSTDRAPAAS